jgi:tetratricopeptide (TPR) repeat protein
MIKQVLVASHVVALAVLWIAPLVLAQSEDYRKALASYRDKRYLEALVWIQQAVAAEDHQASYYLLQGEVYRALRQFSDAEASLRRAVELQPDLAGAHFQLAVLFLRDEKHRQAATALERVVAAEPGNLRARLLLGNVYCLQLNLDSLALQQFTEVARADPRYPAVNFGLGRLLFRQGRDGEAVEHFRSELEADPKHAEARFHLAKALLRMGRTEKVLGHLQALQGQEVDQAELHFFLAKTHHRLKQPGKAIEALVQGIDLKPDFPDAHYLLARLYLETGRPRQARDQMDRFEKMRDREGRGRRSP